LIFDEVKSGATIAAGGAIERYGVQPDLACFAKAIGGGTPAAAFGGRADVMEVIERGAAHQGTFNGNPLVCAAGLRDAHRGAHSRRVRAPRPLGNRLADGCRRGPRAHGDPGHTVDLGAKGLRVVPARAAAELPRLHRHEHRSLLGLVSLDGQPRAVS
jgi:glutamate-1-semialdehyde 2,1-aminomutase